MVKDQDRVLRLPAIGALGCRHLDDVAFACRVVAHDADGCAITIEYSDDGQIEAGLHPDEFIPDAPSSSAEQHHQCDEQQTNDHEDRFERLCDALSARTGSSRASSELENVDSVFMHVVSFLDHFQWTQSLALVSKRWRQQVLHPHCWQTVRIPRRIASSGRCHPVAYFRAICCMVLRTELASRATRSGTDDGMVLGEGTARRNGAAKAHEVVQELVLHGCPVTDDQALQLIKHCSRVTSLKLQKCNHISFMLLYELTRLAREQQQRQQPSTAMMESVDVWLCRGISPAYVHHLRANGVLTRSRLKITGPGFFVLEISADTEQWITRAASPLHSSQGNREATPVLRFQTLSIRFVPKESLRRLFANHIDSVAKELKSVEDHLEQSPFAYVPFVHLDEILMGDTNSDEEHDGRWQQYRQVGSPWSLNDLTQLVEQYEDKHAQDQFHSLIPTIAEQVSQPEEDGDEGMPHLHSFDKTDRQNEQESLDARAEKVFAMLRQTTKALESQVAHLEHQVQEMTVAKDQARQELLHAQFALDQVAKEADRALLSLATSSSVDLSHPPPASIFKETTGSKEGDELLPPLPSSEKLQVLGSDLQSKGFAVLDGFVGAPLSTRVHGDIAHLYASYASRNRDGVQVAHPNEAGADFKLGELAGGNTGRNLRYKMEHVRGDYMLWMDEHDAFCPPSLQNVLRQMDRLVLEQLPAWNLELGYTSLLRKKAMVTCYPGNGARYTKHCDNPNRNGRKVRVCMAKWCASFSRSKSSCLSHRGLLLS